MKAISLLYIKFSEEFPHWEGKTEDVCVPKLPYIKGVGHSSTIISKVEKPSEAEEQKVFWESWFKIMLMELHNLMESKNPDIHQLFTLILNFSFRGGCSPGLGVSREPSTLHFQCLSWNASSFCSSTLAVRVPGCPTWSVQPCNRQPWWLSTLGLVIRGGIKEAGLLSLVSMHWVIMVATQN